MVRTPAPNAKVKFTYVQEGRSSATSSCWRASLASILAAPILLWRTPSCHPVGKACIAIVRGSDGCDRRATGSLPWAALPMHPAAPLLLAHRPSHHPVGEAVGAIVWVSRRSWRDGHHRWRRRHDRPRNWSDWLRASDMVDPAAPRALVCLPHGWRVHCAIEGIDWTARPRRRRRPRWRRCGRRGWRRGRRRSGVRNNWCLGGATDSASAAAILLLLRRPHRRCCRHRGTDGAIVKLG